MTLDQYISNLNRHYKLGNATEHTFRGDLQQLIESICPGIMATNEPKRQKCGAPDYILTKKGVPVGFIEAKDIGSDLDSKSYKEQFDRYKASLSSLIFTDYLTFQFYRDGERKEKIVIGEIRGNSIHPLERNFDSFTYLLKYFVEQPARTIKSPKHLAQMMANKARLLSDIIGNALISDVETEQNSTLKDQLSAFKDILIHDITPKAFADVYAQTIAYGMFAARLHDATLDSFSRQEAAELIPKSNPFLRKLFSYIAGPDLDDRIKWIVDDLVEIFLHSNVAELLKDFGKETKTEDPIIHFYETFLSEYDPKLRKARGVWYTPHPVVSFIVRAVDDILKTEFNLHMGLADSSKIKIKVDEHGKMTEQEVHKVQILDPATGTGTFLAEVIKHIYDNNFKAMQGIWSDYAENNLLPRLNGFELLMASYAMAHLKLDLLLKETGYAPKTDRRLKIYLTNSLEEYHKDTGTLFASWLSSEANEANRIKRDAPVMVIMGNPPYSGISSNNGEWISNLIEDYKYIDGEHFKERKHWLNDDYVKFIRYGQHFVEKNGSGILAFINNHSFIDNPTFRGMRWNLLKTFDKIYILDLHGNAKKKETCHDGSKDENVFDIQQGVSINLFVKTGKKKKDELGQVFHYDLIEKRQKKYEFLNTNSIKSTPFEKLQPKKPNLFFIPKNEDEWPAYKNGISIDELFKKQSMGITTARDHFVIEIDKNILLSKMYDFFDQKQTDQEIRTKYFGNKTSSKYLIGDTRGWKLAEARKNTDNLNIDNQIKEIAYRPFDNRHIFYNKKMVDWGREDIMDHLLFNNYAFICVRIGRDENAHNFLISNQITDKSITSSLDNSNVFPLYLYSDNNSDRTPNLNSEIVQKIADELDLKFTNEKEADSGTFAPIDILDYIYAVLHSPTYREKYKEFLKIDFPRVPYPKDKETFFKLVQLGGELRQIHLLESPTVGKYITQYPVGGENVVNKPKFVNGKVYINDTQYFDGVPEVAWNFYIGGYQPAQKWLKDRKGRKLEFDDILHYQKIIVALTETDRIMQVIDGVEVE